MTRDVYIPLQTYQLKNWTGGYGNPWTLDVFEFIATLLKENFKKGPWQVGKTDRQAITIVNQHSQGELPVIVHVRVEESAFLEVEQSERDLYSGLLSAKGEKFPCLKSNLEFLASDIVSFRPMIADEIAYDVCRRGGSDSHLTKWPNLQDKSVKGTVRLSDFESSSSMSIRPPVPNFFSSAGAASPKRVTVEEAEHPDISCPDKRS